MTTTKGKILVTCIAAAVTALGYLGWTLHRASSGAAGIESFITWYDIIRGTRVRSLADWKETGCSNLPPNSHLSWLHDLIVRDPVRAAKSAIAAGNHRLQPFGSGAYDGDRAAFNVGPGVACQGSEFFFDRPPATADAPIDEVADFNIFLIKHAVGMARGRSCKEMATAAWARHAAIFNAQILIASNDRKLRQNCRLALSPFFTQDVPKAKWRHN